MGSLLDSASCNVCTLFYRLTLREFVDILLEFGVVNAINLDGGGSSTYVVNGTLVNYPSDQW